MNREEKREALRQDVLQAWQDVEETGLHVTGEEAIVWLETCGAEARKRSAKMPRFCEPLSTCASFCANKGKNRAAIGQGHHQGRLT